jgi:hypothetical protein
MSSIGIVYGVPFPTLLSKEFQDVLEKYGVKDLDTGASYVSQTYFY